MEPTLQPQQNKIENKAEAKSSVGSVVGTVIIIAVIILGALYFWGKRLEEARAIKQFTSGEGADNEANVYQSTTLPVIRITATTTTTQ